MRFLSIASGLVLAASLAGRAAAQCHVPDNLTGPQPPCLPTTLKSAKKQFVQPALGICWQQCSVSATANYTAVWSPFVKTFYSSGQTDCGWFATTLKLYQGTTLRWTGLFNVHYAREWNEVGTNPGSTYQVWRYLVNGDMKPVTSAPGPCGAPPCGVVSGNRIRFTGYVDFAKDCATGTVEQAWMVTHACDAIDHAAGFARAGAFHPDRYWTFVGPSLGFVPHGNAAIEAGGATLETVRKSDASMAPVVCNYEEPAQAQFMPQMMWCRCSSGLPAWYRASVFGFGVAGTTFQTVVGGDEFESVSIGAWTNPGAYPGIEELRWNTAEYSYQESCTGNAATERFFGVTTSGGFTAYSTDPSGAITLLPQTFVDQANSKLLPGTGPMLMNVMYRSDHLISLNL